MSEQPKTPYRQVTESDHPRAKPHCGHCGHPSGQHEHFMEQASRPCLICPCTAYTARRSISEADQRANADRPLTHHLDSTERGMP